MSDPRDLRKLALFRDCGAAELRKAARLLTAVDASPGRILMTQGCAAVQFVVVESGEVEVVRHRENGTDRTITVGPGSWVGEMGLLDHRPCSATVRVTAGARVHAAGSLEFRKLQELPTVARMLRASADARAVENDLVPVA